MTRPLARPAQSALNRADRARSSTHRASEAIVSVVLLSIFALGLGAAIGRVRGGSWINLSSTPIRRKGLMIAGVAATLVLTVLTPTSPMFWLLLALGSFVAFAFANLNMTGMTVALIGISLNLLPLLANGAVPVSELALQSVGAFDEAGAAIVDGARESTETADRLGFLGEVVPVPLFNQVVSLGDLIVLVALVDISMNLVFRRSRPEHVANLEEISQGHKAAEPVIDLTDGEVRGPAHAAPGRKRFSSPMPRVRRPLHAAESRPHRPSDTRSQPQHVAAPALEQAAEPSTVSDQPERESVPVTAVEAITPTPEPLQPDGSIDLTDHRPIIDLTVSPTDAQLEEFLRRRSIADSQLHRLAPPSPGHRRYRSRTRKRRGEVADAPS